MKTQSIETMNKIKLIISLIAIVVALLGIFSCEADNDAQPDAQKEFLEKLTGTWNLSSGSIMKDDADITDAFDGMTINFTDDKKYIVNHAVSPIWPEAGTFSLIKNNASFDLLRDDDITISIADLQDHTLKLVFNYASPDGRTEGVSGEFIFNLTR